MKARPFIVLINTGYVFAKVKGGLCFVLFRFTSVITLLLVNTAKFNFKLVFHVRSNSVIIIFFAG